MHKCSLNQSKDNQTYFINIVFTWATCPYKSNYSRLHKYIFIIVHTKSTTDFDLTR